MILSPEEYIEKYFPRTRKSLKKSGYGMIVSDLMRKYNSYLNGDKFHFL